MTRKGGTGGKRVERTSVTVYSMQLLFDFAKRNTQNGDGRISQMSSHRVLIPRVFRSSHLFLVIMTADIEDIQLIIFPHSV